MKKILQSKVVFFVKSMAWSLMLYSALMLAFNWDDVSRAVNGNEAITAVNTMVSQPQPGNSDNPDAAHPTIAKDAGAVRIVYSLVKTIAGFVK